MWFQHNPSSLTLSPPTHGMSRSHGDSLIPLHRPQRETTVHFPLNLSPSFLCVSFSLSLYPSLSVSLHLSAAAVPSSVIDWLR